MDFFAVKTRTVKDPESGGRIVQVYPDFKVRRTEDLMVRGKAFYAIWDAEKGFWSTDEYDLQRLVDAELYAYADDIRNSTDRPVKVASLGDFSHGMWPKYRQYIGLLGDNSVELDQSLIWEGDEVDRRDYASKTLPYPLKEGSTDAWDEIVGTLYSPEEREKIEWSVGAVVSGDSKKIQKFLVFYGEPGTGKSTIISIIQKLFEGYWVTFESEALVRSGNAFAMSAFRTNPLVAIEHDGDLSRVENNTRLNSIVAHEDMIVNEKFKSEYTTRINAFLFVGTNKPVKITDAKSGIIRRLIDVSPTGDLISPDRYHALMQTVTFELGAIASKCLKVYQTLGRDYYNGYRPINMIKRTDVMFDFVDSTWDVFVSQEFTTLTQAYELYKQYCSESNASFVLPRYKFREELSNYFHAFYERLQHDGERYRAVFVGFKKEKLDRREPKRTVEKGTLVLEDTESLLDDELAACPAQYARNGVPSKAWDKVTTTLSDLDASKEHYVLPPDNHIVIDFDLKDENGDKDPAANLEAASKWPPTYAEFSKSGGGLHLHYIYDGETDDLANEYSPGIEVKVFRGKASIRRRLSRCNNLPIARISSGVPKKEKKVISTEAVKSEQSLRRLIARNLRKEIHPGTKPSVDFIKKILDDAYESGLSYNVEDLRNNVIGFAAGSTHWSVQCLKTVKQMKFKSDETVQATPSGRYSDDRIAYFDCEVFPNLFVVCWKFAGSSHVTRLINPTTHELETLFRLKLVGFNNRQYDNHILYGRYLGLGLDELFQLSQDIVEGKRHRMYGEAYNLSYSDVYDYATKKQGLKKYQIELGLNHQELGLPWTEPVSEDMIPKVVEYCANDVITLEQVADSLSSDFAAREILAELSGLTVNDKTNSHTARIILGPGKDQKRQFEYTELATGKHDTGVWDVSFPGYTYNYGVSTYRGEEVGEGGLVRAQPGYYTGVVVFDVASMHPSSMVAMNVFGPYTQNLKDLLDARLAIKRKDVDKVKTLLGGKLAPFVERGVDLKALSNALKLAINSVYGLTSAKFDNPFNDPRNVDNIVAKRGALFMMDLRAGLEAMGVEVIHIKTDSIKVCTPAQEVTDYIFEMGQKYGYEFEVEDRFKKFCLVNDAVYIAQDENDVWHATGAEFARPVVFKTLFSGEDVAFEDYVETKTVSGADIYLVSEDGSHPDRFVGRAGAFVPVTVGGSRLVRRKDGKDSSVAGSKGYLWREAEAVKSSGDEDKIDQGYYDILVQNAREHIEQFVPYSVLKGE